MHRWDGRAAFVVLGLATCLTPVVLGQPASLSVTPDTLVLIDAYPPFVILNAGADSLRLDSIDVGRCSSPCGDILEPMYLLDLEYGSTWHFGEIWHLPDGQDVYRWDGAPHFPEIVLAPGDSATLRVGIDTCPVCRPIVKESWVPFYFWAGDDPDSLRRTVEFDYFLAGEEAPHGDAHTLVVTGPNPFRSRTEVTLTVGAGHVMVSLFDLLGRRVRALHEGPLPSGAHPISVDAGGLVPGLFFVRAVTDAGRAVATRALILVR